MPLGNYNGFNGNNDPVGNLSNFQPMNPGFGSQNNAFRPMSPRRAGAQLQGQSGGAVPQGFQPIAGAVPWDFSVGRSPRMDQRASQQAQANNQFRSWDQALANSIGADMYNQQGAMNAQFAGTNQQIQGMENFVGQGVNTMQSVGAQQRDAFGQLGDQMTQRGQQAHDEFTSYRDQQLGGMGQGVDQANQFAQDAAARADQYAGDAVSNYEAAIGNFQDRGAQDAANAAFGLRRNVQSQTQMINSGVNADGTMMSSAEQNAARQQMFAETESQVGNTINQIYSNTNQQVASMQGTLSGLMQARGQTALAGGQLTSGTAMQGAQLTTQAGQAFGAQTLQSQQMQDHMVELGAQMRGMGEQAYASSMQQSVVFEMQGRTTIAEMFRNNPRQFVSMYAGLTGYLAGASTPNLNQISLPSFGAMPV